MSQNEHYLGNPNLKAKGVDVEFTKEQVAEYLRCGQDPLYFIKKYVKIVHLDRGLIPFELYDFQEDIVNREFLLQQHLQVLFVVVLST